MPSKHAHSNGKSTGSKRGPAYNKRTTTYSPPNPIVIDSNSEQEIITVDSNESDSGIEELPSKPSTARRSPQTSSMPSYSRAADIIELSEDDAPPLNTMPLPSTSRADRHENDEDSAPEGFEIWEATVPLKVPQRKPITKYEEVDEREKVLTWSPPRMAWLGSECTGASGAKAFLEPVTPRKRSSYFPLVDAAYLSEASRPNLLSLRTRSRYGPPREMFAYLETSILHSSPIVPMPGMHAPRGAVNCIAQSKGFIAVGRSYEESSTYDGGGLTLWRTKTQRAQHLFAHIARRSQGSAGGADGGPLKQYSILSLAFDPVNDATLLSGGNDNFIQLWRVSEENEAAESVGRLHARRPGCIQFCPEGDVAAVGASDG
ncbi:hypothetical protein BDV93DRAFT_136674 [Ceratobasidium sp. AG-I]|nr:hypothetical protein BDV93DRAFT_136674 [Ceratobasidium sp. AG-I]